MMSGRAFEARRSAYNKLQATRIANGFTPDGTVEEPVITPHGGPSVQFIPLNKWPSVGDYYASIDANWETYHNGDIKWKERVEDRVNSTVRDARNTFITTSQMLPKFEPDDVRVRFDVGPDGYVNTRIIPAENAGDPDTWESITIRFNPIFRQFEMSEMLARYGITVPQLRAIDLVESAIVQHFNTELKRYKVCIDFADMEGAKQLYTPVLESPYNPNKRWVWISYAVYPALMQHILYSGKFQPSAQREVILIHKRVKDLSNYADHKPKIQIDLFNAAQIAIKHTGRIDKPRTFTDIMLRNWMLLITANMSSLGKGTLTTGDDIDHKNWMDLNEWGMLTEPYVPPANYYVLAKPKPKKVKKKNKKNKKK